MHSPVPLVRHLRPLRQAPQRPGNYHVRNADGRRVGVATVTHLGAGLCDFFIRTSIGVEPRVQTEQIRVEFERQDEAWTAALESFGRALELDPNALVHED